jgi:hypothetical protein
MKQVCCAVVGTCCSICSRALGELEKRLTVMVELVSLAARQLHWLISVASVLQTASMQRKY